MVPSEENNKTFGKEQSFVPGEAPDWYLQFMEKNTNKYGATGGWGYSNFGKDLKPTTDKKTMYACFMCHQAVAARDYIFTKYSPCSAQTTKPLHGGCYSDLGTVGFNTFGYEVAKAALVHLTRCAAIEFGEHGVRANSISPGRR
jgi:NAD(P)-dependent dehydrogenase (short-subunit alcohol dehydrogenase family)